MILKSYHKHQRQGQWCDGISMEIIDNSYKTAKSARSSTARVMMAAMKPARTSTASKSHNTRKLARGSMVTQVNQHTHRKMRTRSTTNISGNSNDASKMGDLRMTIDTNIFYCLWHAPPGGFEFSEWNLEASVLKWNPEASVFKMKSRGLGF